MQDRGGDLSKLRSSARSVPGQQEGSRRFPVVRAQTPTLVQNSPYPPFKHTTDGCVGMYRRLRGNCTDGCVGMYRRLRGNVPTVAWELVPKKPRNTGGWGSCTLVL